MLNNKVILFGPYVGNLQEEIFSFRPFLEWFKQNFEYKNLFVSTHYTSKFLYDDKLIPIFKQYTNDKKNQQKHLHKKINAHEYQVIKKYIIENIIEISDYKKTEIVTYNLGYLNIPFVSFSQKVFSPLHIKNTINIDKILVICKNKHVLQYLKNNKNITIVDDEWTNEDIANALIKYNKIITNKKHWALLCNLHKKKVFYWGNDISIFKSTYNFNNENLNLFPIEGKLNKGFYSNLNSFIKEEI